MTKEKIKEMVKEGEHFPNMVKKFIIKRLLKEVL